MPLNLIFIQPGTYTIEDNGIPGDNISVIKDQNGVVIFTFGHPADALGFTVSTPGVNIIVNFTDSLNAANFSIGSTDPDPMVGPPQSPDSIVMQNIETTGTVTLAANTTITESSDADAAADITAGALVMSAVSGIGTEANAIETRTGLFEAETTTGGINISNFGSVQIGGVTANVDGLDVATSGSISFVTVGSIFLTEANSVTAGEVVHGGGSSGNVTLIALGANSDIIGNVDNGAVTAPRGSITLTAGRDIQLGTIGSDFNNDVISNSALTFTAGRDILIDGFADILSDNFGLDTGGNLTFTAGRNIGILNVAGVSASVAASGNGGGDAILTTGFNGSLTVNGPGSFALGSTSGDVIVRADRILINAGSGISAPAGTIAIAPATDGRAIILGSATDAAFALELSDVELDRIFTANTLTIGSDQAGQVRVIAAITTTAAGNAPNVALRSGTSILVESNYTVLNTLALVSRDDVFQTAVSTITAPGGVTVLVDAVDDDPNVGALATLSGTLPANNVISGNLDGDTLNGTGGNNTLSGAGGNDLLRGFGGADTLIGGTGADTMIGGLGNDNYFIDNPADTVTEFGGEGSDTVFTSVNYSLASGQEIEALFADNAAATTPLTLVGNDFVQTIAGNAGANTLIGFGGADTLVGRTGNDTYVVSNSSTMVFELVGEGNDIVYTSVNWAMVAGFEIESLFAIDAAATTPLMLFGNEFVQTIAGNAGANWLVGGGGADILVGRAGNDNYIVSTAATVVFEAAGEGNDVVFATVSYALSPGFEIEALVADNAAATTALTLIGNGFGQIIAGNAGANVLNGGAGSDTLQGRGGVDVFAFSDGLGPSNVDTIIDFQVGLDKIGLDDAIFAGVTPGNLASAFVVGTGAGDADDRIIYNPATGQLFYDADGNGAGAQVQFATVTTGLAVTSGDFIVI